MWNVFFFCVLYMKDYVMDVIVLDESVKVNIFFIFFVDKCVVRFKLVLFVGLNFV